MTDDGVLKFLIGFTVHLYFVLLIGVGFVYMLMPTESNSHDVDVATSISTLRGSDESGRSLSQGKYVYVRKPQSKTKASLQNQPVDTDEVNENTMPTTNVERETRSKQLENKRVNADNRRLGAKKSVAVLNYQKGRSSLDTWGQKNRISIEKFVQRGEVELDTGKTQVRSQQEEKDSFDKEIGTEKTKSTEQNQRNIQQEKETDRSYGTDETGKSVMGVVKTNGKKANFAEEVDTGTDQSGTNISDFSVSASEYLSGFVTIAPGWSSGKAKSEKEISHSVKDTESNAKRLRKESGGRSIIARQSTSRSANKVSNKMLNLEEPEPAPEKSNVSSKKVIINTGDVKENVKKFRQNFKSRVEYRSVSFSDDLTPSQEHEMHEHQRRKPTRKPSQTEGEAESVNGASEFAAVEIRNGQLIQLPSEPESET